ncbi:pyridoxal-phosphate dependent enzyme [archaeon]|nr:MAG: pyridoxal-phosphate dependent enzyme [archaeon]
MLDQAENDGRLRPGMTVYEGTSGSTGIALAFQCLARGYKLHVVMPDDQAQEKRSLLRKLGAEVTIVPSCAIANKDHYVNTARRLAQEEGGFFVDQFENSNNGDAHYQKTAREIWKQTQGTLNCFVMSAGTGGTIAGISRYLKERNISIRVVLADPSGSSLCNKVRHNVCYTVEQAERKVRKHRYDSIVEGVGLDRVTANFSKALLDDAYEVKDQTLLNMAHALLHLEGLFVGSSSALNLAVACKVARVLPEGSTVVTIICDNGSRHLSRFWNEEFIASAGLSWPTNPHDGSKKFWQDVISNA